jgi:O-antigen/teichoic acid export membrane protein
MKNKESRTWKAVQNIIWNYGNQLLMLVLSFGSRTVFIWIFGVEYLGLNGIFSDILGVLSLTDLGLNSAMVYSFYEPLAKRDERKLSALVNFYKKIYLSVAAAVFLLGLCCIPFLQYIVHTEQNIPYLEVYYLFALANVAASYLFVYKTSILIADQKNFVIMRINIVINLAKVVMQILSMLILANYIVYLALDLCGNLLSNMIASRSAQKLYPFLEKKELLSSSEKQDIKKTIFSGMIYKISSVLLNATDNLLISILVSTAAVGYYSNYLLIQTKSTLFYSMLFTSITASIGNLIVQTSAKQRYQVFRIEQMISSIVCLIFIPCYVLLVDDFIRFWLGKEYVLAQSIVFAIGFNMYLSCILQPLWSYREATGLYRQTKYVMLLCAALNLVMSIWLGWMCGIFGIIIASGISRLLTYVWYEPHLLFKQYFSESARNYYLSLFRDFLFIAVWVMLLYYLQNEYTINSWIEWIIKAVVILSFSVVFSLAVHWHQTDFGLLKNRCLDFYRSKRK